MSQSNSPLSDCINDVNARGKVLEDYILKNNLKVLNKGDEITYARRDVATQIDVCLASSKLSTYVDHFVERGAIPSSDHISLEFIIKLDPGPPQRGMGFY